MSIPGRKRTITDAQLRAVRRFKPRNGKNLMQAASEIGISYRAAKIIRSGYHFKQPSP